MSPARRRVGGYTVLELMFVIAFIPVLFGAVAQVFGGSSNLVQDSRTELQAHETLRRNLEAVANAVRDADYDTLTGFGSDGWATKLMFARVVGADNLGRVYDGTEVLVWRPSSRSVEGVASPGAVWHVTPTGATLVADRVPAGGFRVRLDAGTLLIHLRSWNLSSAKRLAWVEGETAVALRN